MRYILALIIALPLLAGFFAVPGSEAWAASKKSNDDMTLKVYFRAYCFGIVALEKLHNGYINVYTNKKNPMLNGELKDAVISLYTMLLHTPKVK